MTNNAPPLLAHIDEISPRWIDQVFAHAGLHAPLVASLQIEPFGQGTASTVARLTLLYAGDPRHAPRTLIAKFPKITATGAAPDAQLLGYEREVMAYRFFQSTPAFRLPKCYFADIRADGVFNLILEELCDDCWPGNQITGCSIAEARAVVDTLAQLHAAYCDTPELHALSWPKRRRQLADQSARLFAAGAAVIRERNRGELGAAALATIDGVAPLVGPWSATTSTPETLIHTDARVDNIIFERTPRGINACLIDLQSMAIGAPAHDLAYFLSGSLEPAERAQCERELVAKHAAVLIAAGAKLDPAMAWERYRQHAIAGLVATVCAAAILPNSPAIDRLLVTLARRNCAAVQELDGIEAARAYLR